MSIFILKMIKCKVYLYSTRNTSLLQITQLVMIIWNSVGDPDPDRLTCQPCHCLFHLDLLVKSDNGHPRVFWQLKPDQVLQAFTHPLPDLFHVSWSLQKYDIFWKRLTNNIKLWTGKRHIVDGRTISEIWMRMYDCMNWPTFAQNIVLWRGGWMEGFLRRAPVFNTRKKW